MGVMGSELAVPEADRLVGDQDPAPGQDVLDVTVTPVEALVEPHCILDDLRREPVPPVGACSTFHLGAG